MRDAIPGSLLRLSTSPAYVPFTGVIGFGLLAGARRGKDDRWPAPDAVPERRRDPIATCGWSIDIVAVVRTKRCKMVGGLREECDRGSAMADRLLEDGPGNHRPSPHPPSYVAGQLVDVAGGWARKTAGSGRVSGAMVHMLKCRLGAQRGDAIADWPPCTRNPQARHRT